jgi:hypothetical protein
MRDPPIEATLYSSKPIFVDVDWKQLKYTEDQATPWLMTVRATDPNPSAEPPHSSTDTYFLKSLFLLFVLTFVDLELPLSLFLKLFLSPEFAISISPTPILKTHAITHTYTHFSIL